MWTWTCPRANRFFDSIAFGRSLSPVRALSWLEPLIGPERDRSLRDAAASACKALRGRTVGNVSSTAAGGGVAEMLQVLIGYTLDASIDSRWLVMSGDPEFFTITKRIHIAFTASGATAANSDGSRPTTTRT